MRIPGGVFGSLLKHGVVQFLHGVQERAETFLAELENHVGAWVGRLLLKYAIVTALAVGALASLCGAAKEGLIAAGLPSWAAQLILGVLMGAAAAILLKADGRVPGDTRGHHEDGGQSPDRSSGFAIHIHPPDRSQVSPSRGRSRSKHRAPRVVRVKHLRKGWQVESGPQHRTKRLFENKRLAMKAARAAARRASAQVVVLGTGKKAHTVVERRAASVEPAA